MRFFWWRRKKRVQHVAQERDGSGISSLISGSGYQSDTAPAEAPPGHSGVSSLDDSSDEKHSYGSVIARHYIPSSAIERFTVVECTGRELVLSNCLLVHSLDFLAGVHVMVNDRFPFTTKHDNSGALAPGQVGIAVIQRQWMELPTTGAEVTVLSLELDSAEVFMTSLHLEIDFWNRGLDIAERFSAKELGKSFIKAYSGQIFRLNQKLVFDFHGQVFRAFVKDMNNPELPTEVLHGNSSSLPSGLGVLVGETEVTFTRAADSRIKIRSNTKKPPLNVTIARKFVFEDLGIGGLDKEFSLTFRRALASRLLPPGMADELGIQHLKGVLLFGPAGTGKTLLARNIGKILRAREPKIVKGPEIGALGGNLEVYLANAEKEYQERGEESGLHIIIFDELDAIFKRSDPGVAGEGNIADTAVHRLLSKMDGVGSLNNILFIGTTNRLDLIDSSLLRPGRFEICLEIPLPDEQGRFQILKIHTSKMKSSGRLHEGVDLDDLAALTTNFSGVEICRLVKGATSFACNRHVKVGATAGTLEDIATLRVNKNDFLHALDEIHPVLGASEEELQDLAQHGIIHFDESINTLLSSAAFFVNQVRESNSVPLLSVLLHGPPGCGKTAIAATIALASQFPFIRLVSPQSLAGLSESQRLAAIKKVFLDSYESSLSVIVIDDIERLLGWAPIGQRFSNAIFQVLWSLLQRRPPKGRRLLVLATTSNRNVLTELQMLEAFHTELAVHPISTLRSLEYVLRSVDLFADLEDCRHALRCLDQAGFGRDKDGGIGKQIGIKNLLDMLFTATREPQEIIRSLVEALGDADYEPTNSEGSGYGRPLATW